MSDMSFFHLACN